MTTPFYTELMEPAATAQFQRLSEEQVALASIAVSLKRIADELSKQNEYGEGAAEAIGGNIKRALSGGWR